MKERTQIDKLLSAGREAIFDDIANEAYDLMVDLQDAVINNESNDIIRTKAMAFYKKYREYTAIGGTDDYLFDDEASLIHGVTPPDYAIGQITKNEQTAYNIAQ